MALILKKIDKTNRWMHTVYGSLIEDAYLLADRCVLVIAKSSSRTRGISGCDHHIYIGQSPLLREEAFVSGNEPEKGLCHGTGE